MQPTNVPNSSEATLLRSAIASVALKRDRLAQILDDYLAAVERGASITPERLLSQHPDDAEKLKLYLEGLELFQDAVRSKSLLIPNEVSIPDVTTTSEAAAGTGSPSQNSSGSTFKGRSHPRVTNLPGEPAVIDPQTALLQSRIRAAALCCAIWWSTILIMPLLSGIGWSWVPATVTGCLAAIYGWLSYQRVLTAVGLRKHEFLVFGLMAGGFAVITYWFLRDGAAQNDATAIALATKNADIAAMTLLFPYAMLIPNSWKRALPMIVLLAFYPFAVTVVFFTLHPEALALAGTHTVFEDGALNLFKMLIAASLSLYGVHVLDTLRIEAFEARRLNQYHLGERIGEGGMGVVYRAEHRLLKRPCAVKLIQPQAAADRDAIRRFEREVRSTARLSHPNIVQIYDYGYTADSTFYYVMEYLNGVTVAELVEQEGPQPPARVVNIISQACLGLAEAHAAGLLHRDIKPANLLVADIGNRHDVTKLLDFGLVVELDGAEKSRPDGIAGTPLYMAPEQANGVTPIDHRADLYALGGVAFFLMTGKPPFERDSLLGTLLAHANEEVKAPSTYIRETPTDLDAVIVRCLAKSPADRYPDAIALYTALQSCADAETFGSGNR